MVLKKVGKIIDIKTFFTRGTKIDKISMFVLKLNFYQKLIVIHEFICGLKKGINGR